MISIEWFVLKHKSDTARDFYCLMSEIYCDHNSIFTSRFKARDRKNDYLYSLDNKNYTFSVIDFVILVVGVITLPLLHSSTPSLVPSFFSLLVFSFLFLNLSLPFFDCCKGSSKQLLDHPSTNPPIHPPTYPYSRPPDYLNAARNP